jgi:glycerate kinase
MRTRIDHRPTSRTTRATQRHAVPSFTVLVAPSGFKEGLDATQVADGIVAGVRCAMPDARVLCVPMIDGGEGFSAAMVRATQGRWQAHTVTGPLGVPVAAGVGLLGGEGPRTAAVEVAAAAGLRLVPRDARDPMTTTSRGVGELIRAALDAGAERILLGCGDSGINDGGAGMVQALGARLLDADGSELGAGGGALHRLAHIDLSRLDARLAHVQLDAAVNWHNVLLGERGVARVFGPQKGATPQQVVQLGAAFDHWAACIRNCTGAEVGHVPGGGASGGLGAAFAGLLGGTLHPRFDLVMRYLDFDALLRRADLVITAEGCLDSQTPFGKVPAEVARRAKLRGLPVVALAGALGTDARLNLVHGIDAFASIQQRPCTLDESMENASEWLARAAENTVRLLWAGTRLAKPNGRVLNEASWLQSTKDATDRIGARRSASKSGRYEKWLAP